MIPLSEPVARALADLRGRLERRFGPRLRRLTLFGSWARGEAGPDSDVDVLVVVDGMDGRVRREVYDLAAEVWMDTMVRLAPLALSPAEMADLERRERLIALDIARDGVPL
ncbi:MAG: nucleotidyltransferase domain-containing protein [Deltaproteobacteria bacterium]|nr:nucleotidyltransferase domain-containing protein [Deltaproteobacteria bacterium]